jgi:hypothetical protein
VPGPFLQNTQYTLTKLVLPFQSALHKTALYGVHSFRAWDWRMSAERERCHGIIIP